jgi:hypothetical protein
MWVELCSNKFFNLDEAEMIFCEMNSSHKYDIKITRKGVDKRPDPIWKRDIETYAEAIQFIRNIMKDIEVGHSNF